MPDDLLDIINEILIKDGRKPLKKLDQELSLTDDIGFDSLDLALLTVKIEDKYYTDIFEDGIVDRIQEIVERLSRGEVR